MPPKKSSKILAILNPEHLLEQANRLIAPPPAGPPRQVDLRRAISAAYYAVFHATLATAADRYVGAINRATSQYTLVYRSVDHKELRELCSKVSAPKLSGRLTQYIPAGGFDVDIRSYAQALLELQEKRFDADYNPSIRVRSSDARLAIGTARDALRRLQAAHPSSREAFLGLLLFKVR
jgi:hypothetical protein